VVSLTSSFPLLLLAVAEQADAWLARPNIWRAYTAPIAANWDPVLGFGVDVGTDVQKVGQSRFGVGTIEPQGRPCRRPGCGPG